MTKANAFNDCIPIDEGDLIRVKRMLFSHWAVYAGNGSVIHITGKDDVPSERNSTAEDIEAQLKAYIKKEKFEKMLAADTFAVANSQYDNRKLLGFNFKPLRKSKILERLNRFLGKIYPYSLFYLNCEHFSTFARYGTAISDQVSIESLWKVYSGGILPERDVTKGA
uniref:LRAT domain-containing protein n=1 Tax=Erpetoichthys calabaricus TaxID=27687 RepID=A0A8C4S6M3_ERPCA